MDPKQAQKILLDTANQYRELMSNLKAGVNVSLSQMDEGKQKDFILESLKQAEDGKLDLNNFINELNQK